MATLQFCEGKTWNLLVQNQVYRARFSFLTKLKLDSQVKALLDNKIQIFPSILIKQISTFLLKSKIKRSISNLKILNQSH